MLNNKQMRTTIKSCNNLSSLNTSNFDFLLPFEKKFANKNTNKKSF